MLTDEQWVKIFKDGHSWRDMADSAYALGYAAGLERAAVKLAEKSVRLLSIQEAADSIRALKGSGT